MKQEKETPTTVDATAGSSQDDLTGLNDAGRAVVAREGDRLKENIYTVPNALSLSRIILAPVIAHQVRRLEGRASMLPDPPTLQCC